jgi:ABC-type amino acid transport system permease subunit
MYCFYLFLVLLVFDHYHLDVSFFKKIQDYEDKSLSSSNWEAWQVTLDHIDPTCSLSISSIHIGLHALILYLCLLLRIWVYTWLAMLSHAVMRVVQIFPSMVMLSLACVFVRGGLPSVEM